VPLNRHRLPFQSPKQLRVSSYDDGGETHCDCADAHGQIKSPSGEKTRCHRRYRRSNSLLGSMSVVKTMTGEVHRDMHRHYQRRDAGSEGDPDRSGEAVANYLHVTPGHRLDSYCW
jgi:hypothetical protein